jgi:uncharacterized protein YbbC (DUF1343 family)
MPIDILSGSAELRAAVEARAVGELVKGWAGDEEAFRRLRTPFLLY